MAEPLLTPAQRRVVSWGVIALALGIAAAGGITVMRRAVRGLPFFGQRAEPRVTQEIVVERLRAVASSSRQR